MDLKKATDLNEKYSYKTQCKYLWNECGFETQIVENKKEPVFDYHYEHMQVITDDLVQHLMYNTLTVRIYGMIKSKKPKKEKVDHMASAIKQKTLTPFQSTGDPLIDKRI